MKAYPCLYGLKDYCEAITLLIQQYQQPPISPIEPETREEKVIKRIAEAYFKYWPPAKTSPSVLTSAMRELCQICPRRLAELKKLGEPVSHVSPPARTPARRTGVAHSLPPGSTAWESEGR